MTLPIGSGFFTGDIPGRVIPAKGVTARPQGLADQAAAQKTNTDYVKKQYWLMKSNPKLY